MAKGSFWNPMGFSKARVRQLHRRGFAVRGFLPGQPDALQPRLTSYLRKQATQDIRTAYEPVEKELTSREARVNAIKDKRTSDHQAYQSWLVGQQQLLRTQAEARQTALSAASDQARQATTDALLKATEEANARRATAGGIGTSGVLGEQVAGSQRAVIEGAAAQATRRNEAASGGTDTLAATQANNIAYMKALEAKDFAKSLDELSDVADAKTKVQLQKGSDTAKRIASLLDQEVAKAQQTQQMQLAGQKLGVQLAGVRQRDRANKRTTETSKRGQDLTFQAATRRAAIQADNAAETQRHNRAQEKANRDKLKQQGAGGEASKQERAQRVAATRAVNKMKSFLTDQLGPGKHPKKGVSVGDFNDAVQVLREQYPNDADLILVAYDLWRFGHLRGGSRHRWMSDYGYAKPKGW